MRILMAALALACAAFASPARADLYECKFAGENSWVPKTVVVEAGPRGAEVAVFDPIIKYFLNAPTTARVEADNGARTTFAWSVEVKNRGQRALMKYRMTRLKADASATLHAQAVGFAGPFSGFGSCRTLGGSL